MRKLFFFITIFGFISFLVSTAYSQAPLIITGNPDSPPICWTKNKTSLQGVGPDLATKILKELDVQFSIIKVDNWSEVQKKIALGKADMIVSAYKNTAREQYMEYSIPFLESPVVIVVKKGEKFLCNCWEDLVGKKGVAGVGESFGDKFDSYITEKLDVTYTAYERAFKMLEEDVADYLIVDLYPALIYSKLLMAEDKIDYMDKPVTTQQLHMTISKKSPYLHLMPKINARLKELRNDKGIKKLAISQYQRWHKTFQERQRFFAKSQKQASKAQSTFNSEARDRGLDNLARFYEREVIYMDGSANLVN